MLDLKATVFTVDSRPLCIYSKKAAPLAGKSEGLITFIVGLIEKHLVVVGYLDWQYTLFCPIGSKKFRPNPIAGC